MRDRWRVYAVEVWEKHLEPRLPGTDDYTELEECFLSAVNKTDQKKSSESAQMPRFKIFMRTVGGKCIVGTMYPKDVLVKNENNEERDEAMRQGNVVETDHAVQGDFRPVNVKIETGRTRDSSSDSESSDDDVDFRRSTSERRYPSPQPPGRNSQEVHPSGEDEEQFSEPFEEGVFSSADAEDVQQERIRQERPSSSSVPPVVDISGSMLASGFVPVKIEREEPSPSSSRVTHGKTSSLEESLQRGN